MACRRIRQWRRLWGIQREMQREREVIEQTQMWRRRIIWMGGMMGHRGAGNRVKVVPMPTPMPMPVPVP